MWLQIKCHCNLVRGCMVYTEHEPSRQQFVDRFYISLFSALEQSQYSIVPRDSE